MGATIDAIHNIITILTQEPHLGYRLNGILRYTILYIVSSSVAIIILTANARISAFISVLCVLFVAVSLYHTHKSQQNVDTVNSAELSEYLSNLTDRDYQIARTDQRTGSVLPGFLSDDVYIIPSEVLNSKSTVESKVIVSHEYCHISNHHSTKLLLFDISTVILTVALYISMHTYVVIPIIAILMPVVRNYIRHQFEYQADLFAASNVSRSAVVSRLQHNSDGKLQRKIPYLQTHPRVLDRIERVYYATE